MEACGICHSDSVTKEGYFPGLVYPLIPGHEVVGTIDALGSDVSGWSVGQRVGLGWFGGHCSRCDWCRRGDFTRCSNADITGVTRDGGYAEFLTASVEGLVAIPDALNSIEAAPLLCAGISTYNGLLRSGAGVGEIVVVQGIGGLGHLAIQFAARFGHKVIAIDKGTERRELALSLGASVYYDADRQDVVSELQAAGGAKAILAVHNHAPSIGPMLEALTLDGTLMVLGVPEASLEIVPRLLLSGRSVKGSSGGTSMEAEQMMCFCADHDVRPIVEVVGLGDVPHAYERMQRGEARFRYVIDPSR